jgi:23S rRNA (cytidine1920-2'-O)/16S rRNA (cytidine1409-2'-O)-methyltransferase
MKRIRLDKLLVDRGLCQSRERARALIMAGKVLVKGMTATKAGTQVDPGVDVTLKEDDHPWVSRGALKLVKGLDEFEIDPSGWVAIDVGASTGGFTDVLLSRGARRVFAIDVGYGQLDWKLRNDERVTVLERENVRYLDPAQVDETPDIAVIDVSFISLTLVLPKVHELLATPGKPVIALIKPQFEAGKDQVGKGGVVRDEAIRQQCIDKVQIFARHHGFEVGPVVESPIRGPAGNVEFLQRLDTA